MVKTAQVHSNTALCLREITLPYNHCTTAQFNKRTVLVAAPSGGGKMEERT